MIAPDANLLIYAYEAKSPFHTASRLWWESLLDSNQAIGIPVLTIHAFLRIVTQAKAAHTPVSTQAATAVITSWTERRNVRVLYPGPNHLTLFWKLVVEAHATGRLISDAALGAITLEHDAILFSHDQDFTKFPSVRWHDPIHV